MQFKETLVRLSSQAEKASSYFIILFLFLSTDIIAQTTFFQQGAKENVLLERLEIKLQTDSVLNFSKVKPISRKHFVTHIGHLDSTVFTSRVDEYNMHSMMLNNIEWATGNRTEFESKRPWGRFYQTPANFFEVNNEDFFLAINPVFQYVVGKENDYGQHLFLNSRGLSVRGRIANKVGFAAYMTENQERDPLYVQRYEKERQAVPGVGYYKEFKQQAYDYFDARGYFSFNVAKFIDISFGYDRHFIGNGHRSLFLSDFANSALFLKLNTRVWKLNYQNLFMELEATHRREGDRLLPKKYAAMHHLDLGVTRWLNIGIFEGVVFGRENRFEFGYLNPVIFYRSVEQQKGSFDNSIIGLDAKANVAKHFQFYSQFSLDEFLLSEARQNRGWWGNKWGLQAGVKYIDAFNINNLDLQLETNIVRPFTYSHDDSVANYTHYNQPLAHPLGANFREWIGIARFQPAPKWMIVAKGIYYLQGKDRDSISYGSNIFLPNLPPFRRGEYGYEIGAGVPTKTSYASMLLSYELRQNLFLELNTIFRKESSTVINLNPKNTSVISAGIRWNMHRREFDF